MAEFPPNLDDGELWLPSDIFLGEVPNNFHRPHQIDSLSADELARHLAALSLFQSTAISPPISHFERFRPPVQYGGGLDPLLAAELYRVNAGLNVGVGQGMVCRNRAAPLYASTKLPVYEYNFVKPTQPQVESFLVARARVLQRQQNRLRSRLMPVQGRSGGGLVRESGGTGVFLPRIVNTSSTTTTNNTDFRKKQGPRNRKEIQVAQERPSMKRVGVDKVEQQYYCQFPPSPEKVLPQEWTY